MITVRVVVVFVVLYKRLEKYNTVRDADRESLDYDGVNLLGYLVNNSRGKMSSPTIPKTEIYSSKSTSSPYNERSQLINLTTQFIEKEPN